MSPSDPVATAKAALRTRLLAARRALPPADRQAAGATVQAAALALPELGRAGCVAAYVSMGTEPSTEALREALLRRGARLLLPVLLADGDLDWAQAGPGDELRPHVSGSRLLEPAGPRLGPAAVAAADVVVVPAVAVDSTGVRLGRGGGSYDRALRRRGPYATVVALLHEGELLPTVPAAPHDARVDIAVTPGGVHRFAGGSPALG